MKRLISILSGILLTVFTAQAQNHNDALRYSRTTHGGTSRFMATGGAFGALGADFSTLSFNPAGIGVFKSTEFTFSTGIFTGKTLSSFNGNNVDDMKYNLNFGNIGMVWASETGATGNNWTHLQFGIGVNRLANFNNRAIINGPNNTSLMEDYLIKAKSSRFDNFDPFDVGMAWETFLIDTAAGGSLFTWVPTGIELDQRKDITTWGGINEMVFSFGGNYGDKLFLGTTIGLPLLNYNEESTYTETLPGDTNALSKYYLDESIKTSGSGVNLKLGAIYRPFSFLRIGAALHTPTFYTLNEEYSRSMTSVWNDNTTIKDESGPGKFNYELTTPMKAIGSVAFIISTYGFISIDYEFVDYSASRLRSKGSSTVVFSEANDKIRNNYSASSNLRIGGELRLMPLSIRAGYAIYESPYKESINDGRKDYLSFGIGLREKNYFVDFAYITSAMSEDYYLYPSVGSAAKNTMKTSAVTATLGVKF